MKELNFDGFLSRLEAHGLSLDEYRDGYKVASAADNKFVEAIIKIAKSKPLLNRLMRGVKPKGGLSSRLSKVRDLVGKPGSHAARMARATS